MLDNDVEAVGGFRIDQVAVQAEKALPWLPNVVLMHFGNNDGIQDYDVAHAHERLGALIDRVISAIPGVTVIVSTLFLCTDPVFEARIQVLNANIPGMVKTRVNQGKKVQLIDMHDDTFTTSDHFDSIHPNDGKLSILLHMLRHDSSCCGKGRLTIYSWVRQDGKQIFRGNTASLCKLLDYRTRFRRGTERYCWDWHQEHDLPENTWEHSRANSKSTGLRHR